MPNLLKFICYRELTLNYSPNYRATNLRDEGRPNPRDPTHTKQRRTKNIIGMPRGESAGARRQSFTKIHGVYGSTKNINHNVQMPHNEVRSEVPDTINQIFANPAGERL